MSQASKLEQYRVNLRNISYQVSIARDGTSWCALLGRDLQAGVGGFWGNGSRCLI